ncbi:MAG: MBL fold metallo-hydrolase [Candidatus Omnitrophica bacterium]|nr:MBL fold metallo-hydrolase [Candidatus Omnitrophota bacterium]
MIVKFFPCGPLQANCYLLYKEGAAEALAIDAPPGSAAKVAEAIARSNLKVCCVVDTHGHFDHTSDNMAFKRKFGAKIGISRLGEKFITDPASQGFQLPFDMEPSKPDFYLDAKTPFSCAGFNFKVIPTPGHTAGSVCLYEKEEGALFSGDTLFADCPGRTDLEGSDPISMEQSLKRLSLLPPETIVYPGHGKRTTIGDELYWMTDFKA